MTDSISIPRGSSVSSIACYLGLLMIATAMQPAYAQPNDSSARDVSPFGWENQYPDPFGSRVQGVTAADRKVIEESRSGQLEQHVAMIAHRIRQYWIRPDDALPNVDCNVHITQTRQGEVLSLEVTCCNGDDAVVRSIEAAVSSASPLPLQPNPALFQRNLDFRFIPDKPQEEVGVTLDVLRAADC